MPLTIAPGEPASQAGAPPLRRRIIQYILPLAFVGVVALDYSNLAPVPDGFVYALTAAFAAQLVAQVAKELWKSFAPDEDVTFVFTVRKGALSRQR